MKKLILTSLTLLALGCKPANHKVTFNVLLQSTNGKESLVLECYKAQELQDYFAVQNKAFLEGKAATSQPPKPAAKYNSNGEPAHDLRFTLDLPE